MVRNESMEVSTYRLTSHQLNDVSNALTNLVGVVDGLLFFGKKYIKLALFVQMAKICKNNAK